MEASRRMLLDQGGAVMHEALLPGGAHAVYVEMGEAVPIIELIRLDPKFDALFGYIRRMAADWDGSEPVRAISPESEWVRKTDG